MNREAILFFIPGNPGVTAYYKTFFSRLQAQFPRLDIISAQHLGFNASEDRRPVGSIDLDAQVAHKIDLLEGILLGQSPEEKSRGIPIYVAGHSVGAYMAIKVLEARPDVIQRAYLLFPTLNHIASSPQGVITVNALRIPGLIAMATGVTWILSTLVPSRTKYDLVKWFTAFPDDAVSVTANQVLTTTAVHTALTLARSEMQEINAPDERFWEKYASRCSAYWATTDHWVSNQHREILLGIAKGMESYTCKVAPHGFCIRHSDLVADQVGTWLERDLKALGSV